MSQLVPSELKVAELRSELAARNLPTNGLKKDLVKRLEEAFKASEESTAMQDGGDDQIELLPADEQAKADFASDSNKEHAEDAFVDQIETGEAPSTLVEDSSRKRKMGTGDDKEIDDVMMETDELVATQPSTLPAENGGKLASGAKQADALYIKNLARPLTVFRVKELLCKFGTVDDVWLNSIKTRGYASFSTKEEAESALAGINGTKYPPEHGKILECGFITKERMKELIAEEESMIDSVSSIDLVTIQDDGRNCGVALVNLKPKGKNATKKHRSDEKPGETEAGKTKQADKSASNNPAAITVVSIAATAAANDTKGLGNNKRANRKDASSPVNSASASGGDLAAIETDALTRKTKTQPTIVYRPLTDEEVATKKAVMSADSSR
ncbi:hypothetical protein GGI25_006021 [Coemansia spiralis]|uniref:SAP domain-containing protein n=2 Tax=Coemansia TaxID=4863 RepID=A0A9W8KU48_9FUNG|nr:hypothetical protein BX070DRAFT_220388 [Coemansia spiralis]KAJ1987121.1 hypothetical protein EDC05_005993 [Coemansia umbellata]KAJ2619055.1 hypothetical protein GGI26_006141 [Coemansia sp. RSA 1358]KAJ2669844.1 hypothetical protein GGI25_006021 [Coemansia spiralis]